MEKTCELEKCPKDSKVSLREHLEQVYKQTGRKPKLLQELPDLPEEVAYLVDWYGEVRGASPLTYTELRNWADLTKTFILPDEVKVIMELDNIYWKVITSE